MDRASCDQRALRAALDVQEIDPQLAGQLMALAGGEDRETMLSLTVRAESKAGFNPSQARSPTGQWSAGGSGSQQKPKKPPKRPAVTKIHGTPRRLPPPFDAKRDIPGLTAVLALLGDHLHIRPGDENSPVVLNYLRDLAKVPLNVLRWLLKRGSLWNIYLGNVPVTDLDSNQWMKGQQPRGWPPGTTWEHVAAVGDTNGVSAGRGQGESASGSVFLHELGHSADARAESATDAWMAIWRQQLPHLDPYLQQPGYAGSQEFFAEVFSTAITNPRAARRLYGDRAVAFMLKWMASLD